MPQTVPKSPMYGLVEPTVARKVRLVLQSVHLAAECDAHRALAALQHGHEVIALDLAQPHVFLEARAEDGRQTLVAFATLAQILV